MNWTCEQTEARLSDYLDGLFQPAEQSAFNVHVNTCERCAPLVAAVARALGKLPVVIELCAPFLEAGGLLVAQRSGDLDAELTQAAPVFKALHLWSRTPIYLDLPGLAGHGLVVGEKYAPTPEAYPRRPGMPRKRPIGTMQKD